MEYGRDIVIRLPDASVEEDAVRAALANFVTVLSLTATRDAYASPATVRTLHARLLSPTHVDHLLNVLSGKLRVSGFMCKFARPLMDDDSDEEEDETLVEDLHGSFHAAFLSPSKSMDDGSFLSPVASRKSSFQSTHSGDGSVLDAFLSPPRKPSLDDGAFHDAFLSPSGKSASSPISIPMIDHSSSIFLTPPQSLSQSTLGEGDWVGGAPPRSPPPRVYGGAPEPPAPEAVAPLSTIPIGLHPEIAVLDPSPERPENRAPRRRVAELAAIYERGAEALADGASAPPRLFLAADGYDVAARATGAFLPLPAPYHLLPNTPYFRNAPIAPPPNKPPVPPGPAQRVMNRYINSMKVMDNLDEMEIQSLMCFNFNRTIGSCPYTMPEKAPLELGVPADRDDIIDEDWSCWSYANDPKKKEEPAEATVPDKQT